MNVQWPKKSEAFRRKVALHAPRIRTGTLLAIDPASGSSSMPGYALYTAGILTERGTIKITGKKDAQTRLAELYECLKEDFAKPDILAIEELRGPRVSPVLHWAAGVTIAAVEADITFEVPIQFWKSVAKVTAGYEKADDMDAQMIGEVLIRLASGE